jgi:hypothetical protein
MSRVMNESTKKLVRETLFFHILPRSFKFCITRESEREQERELTPVVSGTAVVEVDCTTGTVEVNVVLKGNRLVGKDCETSGANDCGRAFTLCMQIVNERSFTNNFIFAAELELRDAIPRLLETLR